MALTAEADNRDLLALNQIHIRIAVVVHAHLRLRVQEFRFNQPYFCTDVRCFH